MLILSDGYFKIPVRILGHCPQLELYDWRRRSKTLENFQNPMYREIDDDRGSVESSIVTINCSLEMQHTRYHPPHLTNGK